MPIDRMVSSPEPCPPQAGCWYSRLERQPYVRLIVLGNGPRHAIGLGPRIPRGMARSKIKSSSNLHSSRRNVGRTLKVKLHPGVKASVAPNCGRSSTVPRTVASTPFVGSTLYVVPKGLRRISETIRNADVHAILAVPPSLGVPATRFAFRDRGTILWS